MLYLDSVSVWEKQIIQEQEPITYVSPNTLCDAGTNSAPPPSSPPKKNLLREQMDQTIEQESHFLFNDYITVVINFSKD